MFLWLSVRQSYYFIFFLFNMKTFNKILVAFTLSTSLLSASILMAKSKPYQMRVGCKIDKIGSKYYIFDCKVRKNNKHNIVPKKLTQKQIIIKKS